MIKCSMNECQEVAAYYNNSLLGFNLRCPYHTNLQDEVYELRCVESAAMDQRLENLKKRIEDSAGKIESLENSDVNRSRETNELDTRVARLENELAKNRTAFKSIGKVFEGYLNKK